MPWAFRQRSVESDVTIQRRSWLRRSERMPRRTKPLARSRLQPSRSALKRFISPLFDSHRKKVKDANELWRHLIYAKAPDGWCVRCHKRPWVAAAHCFTKGAHPGMRFILDNGLPLCKTCHDRIDSDHIAKEELFRRVLGDERYDMLVLQSQTKQKLDMTLVILYLESETDKARQRLGYWPVLSLGRRDG